jgi:AraC-like DNA-binding protein/quercetin dioxygenase-like cupin family protein
MMHLRWQGIERRDADASLHFQRVFYPPGFAFPFHTHDFHELLFVVSGSGFHDRDGGSAALEPGMLVAIAPALRHRCRAGTGPLVFVNLVLAPHALAGIAEAVAAIPGWDGTSPPPHLHPSGGDLPALLDHLGDLEGDAPPDRIAAHALVLDLAWRLRKRSGRGPELPAALRRMQDQLDDPAVLRGGASALAAAIGLTREHLTRLARRHLGRPLSTLIAERRLDHAARLLRHGNDPVTSICLASGHGNLGHFHTVFRRRFGCTPQAYRHQGPSGAA